jgi:hypothetical protein
LREAHKVRRRADAAQVIARNGASKWPFRPTGPPNETRFLGLRPTLRFRGRRPDLLRAARGGGSARRAQGPYDPPAGDVRLVPAHGLQAAAVGIFIYGLVGPFAAGLMQTIGKRRTLLRPGADVASTFASLFMSQARLYVLAWGVLSSRDRCRGERARRRRRKPLVRQEPGLGDGDADGVHRDGGPELSSVEASLTAGQAWKPVVIFLSAGCALPISFAALLTPEGPEAIGLTRFGEIETQAKPAPVGRSLDLAFSVLRRALVVPIFWLLFGSFCGLTTNGLVGTHLIAYCSDHVFWP